MDSPPLIGTLGQDNHGKDILARAIGKATGDISKRYVPVQATYMRERLESGDTHRCQLSAAIGVVAATEGLDPEAGAHLEQLASLAVPTVVAVTKVGAPRAQTAWPVRGCVGGRSCSRAFPRRDRRLTDAAWLRRS